MILLNYFGPQPTDEEWADWCTKNEKLWKETQEWVDAYRANPRKMLTEMIKRYE